MPGGPVISQALGGRPARSALAARARATSCPSRSKLSRGWENPSIRSLSLGSAAARLAMRLYRSKRRLTAAKIASATCSSLPEASITAAAFGAALGDIQEGLAQFFMELEAEFLETVFRGPPGQRPFQPDPDIQVQDQGQVRREIVQDRAVDTPDGFTRQTASHALIAQRSSR